MKKNMTSILNLPLRERCDTIKRLVNECTNKELENFFPLLIDDLFGITNRVGWKLRKIKFDTNPAEYDILCKFLHPSGPVVKLCYKLSADCHLKYDFPLAYLPDKIQKMVADGMVPSFYADKLQVDHKSRMPLGLALNPFELYMFHFVYHLVNPNIQVAADVNQLMHYDFLYIRLVEDYLSTFLPCDESAVQPLANYTIMQISPRPHSVHFPSSKPMKSPTLLKQSVVINLSSSVQHNSLHASAQAVPTLGLWRSELVAQLCIDFWLSTSSYDPQFYNASTNRLPLWAQTQFDSIKSYENFAGPIWSQQYLPSGEHIRVVRYMVKHLHYFSNSLVEDSSAMNELKRVIIPSCQSKLYRFLRYTMQHWPLDTSFRLILETWLSYIQPWRYFDIAGRLRDSDEKPPSVDSRWMPFIAENLLAYTLIFQQLIVRFSRVDLATPKNAHMLYRVTKVFSLENLTDYLRDAESALDESSCRPMRSKWAGLVRQHIVDLEGPGFQYQPLFGAESKAEVVRFLGQIKQALLTARSRLKSETENQKGGFFWWLPIQSSGSEYSIEERKKVTVNLTLALNSLKNIFQLEDVKSHNQENVSNFDSSLLLNSTGMQQDIFSRRDCGKSMKDIKYEGDPDLLRIRSFENAFLVRSLYQLALWINTNYHNEIQQLYRRDDWVGGIMRQILSGPQVVHSYTTDGSKGYSPRVMRHLPPRISLRALAHHRTIVLLFLCYLFFYFLGYPLFLVLILAFFIWFLVLLLRYSVGWAPKPPTRSSFNSSF